MALTTTGRLSSSDPNLQNIPIRTEEGRRIRTAFIAAEGHTLLSADYSQIELRLLAHMAEMDSLKQAFRDGVDIHALTASQMFGVPLDQMTSEIRRRAKAINFGIIYGISAHGLSAQLGISRAEASDYIGKYFQQYPGIREYMDKTIAFAREHQYVETLFGRRVHVKDINSKNGAFRQFSERAAINAPLQGTAADIIKLAMVEVHKVLKGRARILLQVHDELVIEAPIGTAADLIPEIKKAMEQVAALSVPLTVEVGQGRDWGSAH
jgi:DNA polymerase-1